MNFVISGFYGLGNTGDEAILDAVISEIRRKDPGAAITVFSLSPEKTAKRHHVESLYRGWRHAFKAKLRALRQADVLISGGGGLLQDRYPTRIIGGPLPYYLLICLLARLAGTPVMFFSQGIGPVTSRYGKFLMRTLGNLPFLITVRDEESKELALRLGIKKPITVTADIVFAHDMPESSRCDASLPASFGNRPRIIVSVRPWFQDTHHYDALALACDGYVTRGYEIVFVPMEGTHDVKASNEVILRMQDAHKPQTVVLGEQFAPDDYLAFMQTAKVVIGMRLHALIFAVLQGVPHTALSYDPKVAQLMRRTGLTDYCLTFDTVTGEEIIQVTDRLIGRKTEVQEILLDVRDQLRKEAQENISLLYQPFDF